MRDTSGARGAGRPVRMVHLTTIAGTQWSFLRGQTLFLKERGFEVHAVSSPGKHLDAVGERDGVATHAVPISRAITPLADLVSLLRLFRLFRRIRPDVVHLSTPKAALLGSVAAWAARVPVRIFFVRGLITEGASGGRRRLFRALERLTAALCHESVCVAPSLLRFAREEGIVAPGRGVVAGAGMSNGIDPQRFSPRGLEPAGEEGVVLGFVGRLARDKGIEEIAHAWEGLREEEPGLSLLLVGSWEEEDPVAPEVRARLEADPRVTVTGFTDDVVPHLRRMSVFLFPSHGTEGFPNAPMEAAAVGLPVIATRVVGCVDAVEEGVTGMLVPPRDGGALREAVRRYVRDSALRALHGSRGRERVLRSFTNERVWDALLAEYRRLLGARGIALPGAAVPGPRPVRADPAG